MTNFYRAGGTMAPSPPPPPGSATDSSWKVLIFGGTLVSGSYSYFFSIEGVTEAPNLKILSDPKRQGGKLQNYKELAYWSSWETSTTVQFGPPYSRFTFDLWLICCCSFLVMEWLIFSGQCLSVLYVCMFVDLQFNFNFWHQMANFYCSFNYKYWHQIPLPGLLTIT